MSKNDSLRLKDMRDAPPELLRALDALRKGSNETARLQRVAAKLGPLLDAPPPPVVSNLARAAGTAPYKRVALKLIVGGLALLVPVLWLMRNGSGAKPQAPLRPSPSVLVAKVPDEAAQPIPEPNEPVAANAIDVAEPSGDREPSVQTAPSRAHRRVAKTRMAAATVSETRDFVQPEPEAPSAQAATPESVSNAQQSAPSPSPKAPQPSAASARATSLADQTGKKTQAVSSTVTPSESALLFEARKAMQSDAGLALRLLDEHARYYPRGLLVPEREVLAIEALRALGRTKEANARLQRFTARYPDSLHRQRLQQ
jgi:hypothetical protein